MALVNIAARGLNCSKKELGWTPRIMFKLLKY